MQHINATAHPRIEFRIVLEGPKTPESIGESAIRTVRFNGASAAFDPRSPARRGPRRRVATLSKLLRQCEYGQRSTQFGVITKLLVATDSAQSLGAFFGIESSRHADAGPAA